MKHERALAPTVVLPLYFTHDPSTTEDVEVCRTGILNALMQFLRLALLILLVVFIIYGGFVPNVNNK